MDELRERLLREGIAPAVVSRYIGELHDHLADLVAELSASGLSPTVARDTALRRLGDPAQLAAPMLADRRFRSIASRAPILAWFAAPLLALAGLAALLACATVLAARNGLPSADLGALAAISLLVAPLAIGWTIFADALRRRARLAWPALGIAATIALGAALQMQVDTVAVAVSLSAPAWPKLSVYAVLTFAPLLALRYRTI